MTRTIAVLMGAVAALAAAARAEWINDASAVPVERLVANLTKRIEAHPDDARAHYVLGRVHSMAWARGAEEVTVNVPGRDDPEALPGFPPWDTVREQPREGALTPERLEHYRQSVLHYRRAATLLPKDALVWLGLGWMLEKGGPLAPKLGTPDGVEEKSSLTDEERSRLEALVRKLAADDPAERDRASAALLAALPGARPVLLAHREDEDAEIRLRIGHLLADDWKIQALEAYRKAYALALEGDLAQESFCEEGDRAVSLEAGEGIVRILRDRPATDATKEEMTKVEAALQKLNAKPRWITPVVFPLDGPAPLADLLADRTVRFDLDGDGEPGLWPWVGPRTGILVWDPDGAGRITSGRQLFGSVTWWLFWRNGYEALAALDDDGDGRLAGRELEGIAVWCDRDGDGVSDPGEVIPAAGAGIAAIAVRAAGESGGVPAHPEGVRLRDGTTRPSYDWTPRRAEAPAGR